MFIWSEYFDCMFFGDFVEVQYNMNFCVIIVDCFLFIFEFIFSFFYIEIVVCFFEYVFDLFYVVDMFFLDMLKSKVVQVISIFGSGIFNVFVD